MGLTRFGVLKELIRITSQPDDYLIATPSSASTTVVSFSDYADIWPDSHWQNGEVIAESGGSLTSRRVSSFNPLTCTITVIGSFPLPPTGEVALVRSWKTLEQYESSIRTAFDKIAPFFAFDATDERHIWRFGQTEYEIPEQWLYVDDILVDEGRFSGDGYIAPPNGSWVGLRDSSSRQELAQKFQFSAPKRISAAYIRVSKIGSPSGTITCSIRSSSGDLPGGSLGSSSVDIGSETKAGWLRVSFQDPVWVDPNEPYWISVSSSYPISSSDHVRLWGGNGYRWESAHYNGTTWNKNSGSLEHRLVDETGQVWRKVLPSSWDISRKDSPCVRVLRHLGLNDGVVLRLSGRERPVYPDSLQKEFDVDQSVLLAVARTEVSLRLAHDTGDMQRVAAALEEGERLIRRLRLRGRPTAVAARR